MTKLTSEKPTRAAAGKGDPFWELNQMARQGKECGQHKRTTKKSQVRKNIAIARPALARRLTDGEERGRRAQSAPPMAQGPHQAAYAHPSSQTFPFSLCPATPHRLPFSSSLAPPSTISALLSLPPTLPPSLPRPLSVSLYCSFPLSCLTELDLAGHFPGRLLLHVLLTGASAAPKEVELLPPRQQALHLLPLEGLVDQGQETARRHDAHLHVFTYSRWCACVRACVK